MARQTPGMVFLGSDHPIVTEALAQRLTAEEPKREPCEIMCSDFDDVSFKIASPAENTEEVLLSIAVRNMPELAENGTTQYLEELFPGMLVDPEPSYSVTLRLNLGEAAASGKQQEMLEKMSQLKRHVMGGPLVKAFRDTVGGTANGKPVVVLHYRSNETMFICPSNEKTTVIFLVDFHDETDRAVASVFLQEFADTRVGGAPPASYSREPPLELSSVTVPTQQNCAGFLSFSLEPRHLGGANLDKAVTLLTGFRAYLMYHVKASKTYLHMRMRKRVSTWLQVLKRAMPEEEKEKKTASGKTFTRK